MSTQVEEREETQAPAVRPKRVYADYSAEFKAEALVCLKANGGNYYQTAKELGIARQTLWQWNKGNGAPPSELVTTIKKEFTDKWRERTGAALEHMTDEKLEKASARDLGIIAGVGTDKMLNLLGEPTQVVEHRVLVKRAYDEIKDLVPQDEARQLISEELHIDLKPDEWREITGQESDRQGE